MVLIYSEASYRSLDGFRLFHIHTLKVCLWFKAIFLPFLISLNKDPLDARGAAASNTYWIMELKRSSGFFTVDFSPIVSPCVGALTLWGQTRYFVFFQ